MKSSTSPALSRRRASLRADSKIMLIVIVAVIALASVVLFFQWRGTHFKEKKAAKAGSGKIHSPDKKSGAKGEGKKSGKKKDAKAEPEPAKK